ncbi:MAG: ATP phosphoribosyltransferase regulatory subunit, partial [Thermoplasmata archaeon]|nr:ATP phosphoribosyltransferase regulatory subunit [Thermoplasmata archaeon]
LIAMAYDILKSIGLKKIVLRVGNLDILRRFLDGIGANDSEMMRLIDKKDFESIEARIGNDFPKFKKFIETGEIDKIEYPEAKRMKEIMAFLDEFSVPYNLDLSIARGLDYYIGIVFEIDAPTLGAEKQIAGGGEYNLVTLLGGRHVPTAGFAIGFDRILIAMENEGFKFPLSEKPVYVAYMQGMVKEAIKVARMLRDHGIATSMDLMARNISKSLEYANRKGMRFAVIVAPEEWKNGKVVVKDMKEGSQKEVEIEKITEKL